MSRKKILALYPENFDTLIMSEELPHPNNLKKILTEQGRSQKWLRDKGLDISITHLSQVCLQLKSTSIPNWRFIAKLLDVSLDDLLMIEESDSSENKL